MDWTHVTTAITGLLAGAGSLYLYLRHVAGWVAPEISAIFARLAALEAKGTTPPPVPVSPSTGSGGAGKA